MDKNRVASELLKLAKELTAGSLRAKSPSQKDVEHAVKMEASFVSSPTLEKIRNHAIIFLKTNVVRDLYQQIRKRSSKMEKEVANALVDENIDSNMIDNFVRRVMQTVYNPAAPTLHYPDSERYVERLDEIAGAVKRTDEISKAARKKIVDMIEGLANDMRKQMKSVFRKIEKLTESEVEDILVRVLNPTFLQQLRDKGVVKA